MSPINRRTPIPAYYQLKQYLKEQIDQGQLSPGDQLPTEAELCEHYQLSRTPVRQALQELVFEGLLVRIPGRGTFIAEPAQPEPAGPLVLRVVLTDDRWREPLEVALKRWGQTYPETSLQLDVTLIPLDELRAYLVEAVGRGEAPDISLLDSVWVAEFASRHYLYPLNEIDPEWQQQNEPSIFPALLEANYWQNSPHAVPISADVSVIWYRRDWFEAEGLAPPQTWDELIAVGRHFRRPKICERYGTGPHPLLFVGGRAGGETATYQLMPVLWSAGGGLIHNGSIILDSPANHEALNFLTRLVREENIAPANVVNYRWDEAFRRFAYGAAPLAIGGSYESYFIRAITGWDEERFLEHVGFIPLPAGPQGKPAMLVGGMSYVIYRQSQHAREALTLLTMANSSEALVPFCQHTGHHPPRIAAARSQAEEQAPFLAQVEPLLASAQPRPALADFARVSEQFRVLVEDCLTGRRSIDEAVPRTAELMAAVSGLPLA